MTTSELKGVCTEKSSDGKYSIQRRNISAAKPLATVNIIKNGEKHAKKFTDSLSGSPIVQSKQMTLSGFSDHVSAKLRLRYRKMPMVNSRSGWWTPIGQPALRTSA